MEAKELRIGNYLLNDKTLVKIDARSIFDIWNDKGLKNYQPIPLTEEWLLKFGWIFNTETNSYEKERMPNGHLTKTSFGWDMFNYVLKSKTTNKTFYFVHQLQNLYFALTGEELTIKTNTDGIKN